MRFPVCFIVGLALLFISANGYSQNKKCDGNDCNNAEVAEANAALLLSDAEIEHYKNLHLPFGKPRRRLYRHDLILVQKEFVVCYDTLLSLPLWTSYLLTSEWANDEMSRDDCFRDDPRLNPSEQQINCKYYSGSGFNRGHLSPRDDFNRSQLAMHNTYLFSNMVPQHPAHNQSTWRWFEAYVNQLAREIDSIYIFTGIVFDYDGDERPDDKDDIPLMDEDESRPLPVPSHSYKMILRKWPDGAVDVIAALVPHDKLRRGKDESLNYIESQCLVSVDDIEHLSGYNFYWRLGNWIERELEGLDCDGLR